MKKALTALILSSVAILAGCGDDTKNLHQGAITLQSENISFIRHEGSNLCFAIITVYPKRVASKSGVGMSEVPCTDEVINLIE
jgi:hypothetical protein